MASCNRRLQAFRRERGRLGGDTEGCWTCLTPPWVFLMLDVRPCPVATVKISKTSGWESKSHLNITLVTAVN